MEGVRSKCEQDTLGPLTSLRAIKVGRCTVEECGGIWCLKTGRPLPSLDNGAFRAREPDQHRRPSSMGCRPRNGWRPWTIDGGNTPASLFGSSMLAICARGSERPQSPPLMPHNPMQPESLMALRPFLHANPDDPLSHRSTCLFRPNTLPVWPRPVPCSTAQGIAS